MNAPHWSEAPAGDYAVVGDPVEHSWSPRMQSAAFAALGLPWTYRAVRVPRGELARAAERLRELGYRGLNVTVPLKEEAFALAKVDARSQAYGAVNALKLPSLEGANTDAPAFLKTLANYGIEPCPVLLLGAGGAARTLAIALASLGFELRIFNRNVERAVRLAGEVGPCARPAHGPCAAGCGLVVDATSAALGGSETPVDWTGVTPGALAYLAAYRVPSRFLREAAQTGLRTTDGAKMLVEQGALSLEWWLGVEAPREAMWEAIRA